MFGKELSEQGRLLLQDFPILATLREHDRRGVDEIIKTVEDCADFNRRYSEPRALEIDERIGRDPDFFDWDLVKAACKYRLLSLAVPTILGGIAGKYMVTNAMLAVEELCSIDAGTGAMIGATGLGISPMLTPGGMAHWDTVLHDVVEGEKVGNPVLMAYAITEPSAGTDVEEPEFLKVARVGMEAKKVAGGYLLNGRKCFISGGREAKYLTVCVATDRTRPLETWTTFLVDKYMEGFSCPRVELKMGQRISHAAELLFEDVFVPDSHVVGSEGEGMTNGILSIMAASRGLVGAIGIGVARGAFKNFLAWARTRRNGKRPIDEERIQMALADMKAAIQRSRGLCLSHSLAGDRIFGGLLTNPMMKAVFMMPREIRLSKPYKAYQQSRLGKALANHLMRVLVSEDDMTDVLALSSLAKFVGSDNAMMVTSRALELMGTDDSIERRWMEKYYRDAKLTQIYEGTNQLNRLVVYDVDIAKTLHVEFPHPFKKGIYADVKGPGGE
jgi:acyl-CoA dehydrogenase